MPLLLSFALNEHVLLGWWFCIHLSCAFFYWLLHRFQEESPRWLLNVDPDRCSKVLQKIAKVNKHELPSDIVYQV